MIKENHRLPIVVLYRNKKCLLYPSILSKRLLGIGHVVVVNTDQSPSISIYYPNKTYETIDQNHNLLNILFDKIRYYMIDQNRVHHSFDVLRNEIKEKKHEENMNELADLLEMAEFFKEDLKNEIVELENMNHQLIDEIECLEKQLDELNHYCLYLNQECVLSTSDLLYKEKKDYVFKVLNQTFNELTENKRYRKKDIIESLRRREYEILERQNQSKKYKW